MAEIIWRQKAKQRLRDVLTYAYNRFGPMTARKMERRIKDRIDTLAANPYAGVRVPQYDTPHRTFRRWMIHRPLGILYYVDESKDEICICTIYDTRTDPARLPGELD